MPETLFTIAELRTFRESAWNSQKRVGLVPTMGALHEGHVSLVEQAREHADTIIVSIFVNPLQFGPNEDFSRYPRTLAADLEILSQLGVEGVFSPHVTEMYPTGSQTRVSNHDLGNDLCGKFRPGHFEGVLTVVMKLFNFVQPDFAVFGQKDLQQLRIIQKMVNDLGVPIGILEAPTVREQDGLAKSSRNRYLTEETRSRAQTIFQALSTANELFRSGERNPTAIESGAMAKLDPAMKVEYLEIRHSDHLTRFNSDIDGPAAILFAGRLGDVRLIDNMFLG